MRHLRKVFLFFFFFLSLILIIALLFAQFAWGGSFNRRLTSSLVPTAQSLVVNPIPTPNFIENIIPHAGNSIQSDENICIVIKASSEQASLIATWSTLYLNEARVSRSDIGISYLGGYAEFTITILRFCFKTQLNSGYHILEFRLATSILSVFGLEKLETYSWAYEVR